MRKAGTSPRMRNEAGHSVIEVALMAPWLFFLFIAIFDFGFFAYALISVQNAARVAALATAPSPASRLQAVACDYVLQELRSLPNASLMPADCSSAPLRVQVTPFADAEGWPASRVTVTYQPVALIPIPWMDAPAITRMAEVRVYGD